MIRHAFLLSIVFPVCLHAQHQKNTWQHLSTVNGDMAAPNLGKEQTALLVADLDKDGINDFVVTERTLAPSVVWYRKFGKTWNQFVIEANPMSIEAGSAYFDIDGDGDLDIVFGGDYSSNEIWWWENPYPEYKKDVSWRRHTIKSSGNAKHHDEMFGDFDNDGEQEFVCWNQGAHQLVLAEIPENTKTASSWQFKTVYAYAVDGQMEQRGTYPSWKGINEHEGLTRIDIDGDGILDIVGGGSWFKYIGDGEFRENIIDAGYTFSRVVAGQLIEGGRPEIVLVAGDGTAPLVLYAWKDGTWVSTTLLDTIIDGHSLSLVDFNHDGHLDIFTAEMGLGNNEKPAARLLLGDGKGNFEVVEILSGYGMHESLMVDLDGDGDLDIIGKPYTWKAPRLDIWINSPR